MPLDKYRQPIKSSQSFGGIDWNSFWGKLNHFLNGFILAIKSAIPGGDKEAFHAWQRENSRMDAKAEADAAGKAAAGPGNGPAPRHTGRTPSDPDVPTRGEQAATAGRNAFRKASAPEAEVPMYSNEVKPDQSAAAPAASPEPVEAAEAPVPSFTR